MRVLEMVISLLIAGILFYAFVKFLFDLSFLAGVGYIISCGLALYRGTVFREPRIVAFIAVGYVLTNIAVSQILPLVMRDFFQGSFMTGIIILSIFLVVWLKGRELQSY